MDLLDRQSLIGIQISGCESEIGRHQAVSRASEISIPDRDYALAINFRPSSPPLCILPGLVKISIT
jgi:hypothetical protein